MHAVWKGSINFGLVNIPVKMYAASQQKEISFVMLHKPDSSEIRYSRICKAEGKEVPWNEIVKGYEYEKGNFVVLEDKDFEKANLKKNKTIEILHFINQKEIDPVYYVKPYFLEPDKNGEKAYGLLRDALKKSHKVGLGKYIIRNREHLAVINFYQDMIILNELRYETELVKAEELNIPPVAKTNSKEMQMALQLIDQLTVPFTPKKYKDTYTEEIKQIIKQKAKGIPIHPKTETPASGKIQDLMSLLQASLDTKPPKKSAKNTKTDRTEKTA